MSALDLDRLRKVRGLMESGATEGERSAARSRATAIAKSAGLTLEKALSELDRPAVQKARGFFDGFDDWMEAKEPGYKIREAAKRAARNARDAQRRAEVLATVGSEAALFARTERETLLDAAIAHLATWAHWTDDDGVAHRYAKMLDGRSPKYGFWCWEDITPAIREALTSAYPWPTALADALTEVQAWDRLRRDRGLFCGGEWNQYAEVECRIALLEHALDAGEPAASWDDIQARFDWKRYHHEWQWIEPTKRDDPFLDQLEADIARLRGMSPAVQSGQSLDPEDGETRDLRQVRRTNAEKRTEVLSMLATAPHLSDREIARHVGVSPQTVNTWRKRRRT